MDNMENIEDEKEIINNEFNNQVEEKDEKHTKDKNNIEIEKENKKIDSKDFYNGQNNLEK